MNIKIITKVLTLENTEADKVLLGEDAENALERMHSDIEAFIRDKQNAKIEWHQSSGSVSEMLLMAKGIPFTQLTAIIHW